MIWVKRKETVSLHAHRVRLPKCDDTDTKALWGPLSSMYRSIFWRVQDAAVSFVAEHVQFIEEQFTTGKETAWYLDATNQLSGYI